MAAYCSPESLARYSHEGEQPDLQKEAPSGLLAPVFTAGTPWEAATNKKRRELLKTPVLRSSHDAKMPS